LTTPNPAVPEEKYDITHTVDLIGSCIIKSSDLVGGYLSSINQSMSIKYAPHLWDENGIMMGLQDMRQPSEMAAQLSVEIALHC
jgi:hypothetical protein